MAMTIFKYVLCAASLVLAFVGFVACLPVAFFGWGLFIYLEYIAFYINWSHYLKPEKNWIESVPWYAHLTMLLTQVVIAACFVIVILNWTKGVPYGK